MHLIWQSAKIGSWEERGKDMSVKMYLAMLNNLISLLSPSLLKLVLGAERAYVIWNHFSSYSECRKSLKTLSGRKLLLLPLPLKEAVTVLVHSTLVGIWAPSLGELSSSYLLTPPAITLLFASSTESSHDWLYDFFCGHLCGHSTLLFYTSANW